MPAGRRLSGHDGRGFRKVLRKPNFTWADHGDALMRLRKPWYYEHEPRLGISVLGARLSELVRR